MNKTDLFLRNINELKTKEIPATVKLKFKLSLLDYIGVTLAGVKAQGEKLAVMITEADEGNTPVIGIDKKLSMENAIFYNGLNAHALDFDDGTNTGIIHLGSPVFSVLLPMAKRNRIPADTFMKAALIGYETSFTMAVTIQPKHKERGYHATGTCGTLGIALAMSELLGFNEKQRKDAFSAAAVSAAGTLKVLEDGSDLKPFNVGKTALMGYIAANMGKAGYKGPDDVLAGDRGFLHLMYGSDSVEFKPILLDGTFAIEKTYIKPYAACRYCHPSIEAALTLRRRHGISAGDIDSILVRTYSLAVNKHDHTEIAGSGSAKMSIPYSVAVAICKGKAGMQQYEIDCVNDAEVINLTKKISVTADEEMSKIFPAKQTAVVEVKMADGRGYSEQVDFPKGEPENPLSVEEVREKFTSLTTYSGRSKAEADEIFDAAMDMENKFDVLLDLISGTKNHL
jgi:2-methylcitrate dehydratase PrpD